MIKEAYCSFEVSKLLKEKGFNESTQLVWHEHLPSANAVCNSMDILQLYLLKDYNVLRTDISDNDFAIWYDEVGYGVNKDLPDIIMASAVDACYEMILKLHEPKIL